LDQTLKQRCLQKLMQLHFNLIVHLAYAIIYTEPITFLSVYNTEQFHAFCGSTTDPKKWKKLKIAVPSFPTLSLVP
jgi:hypothetical protein